MVWFGVVCLPMGDREQRYDEIFLFVAVRLVVDNLEPVRCRATRFDGGLRGKMIVKCGRKGGLCFGVVIARTMLTLSELIADGLKPRARQIRPIERCVRIWYDLVRRGLAMMLLCPFSESGHTSER